jgi:CheY-like chemotaxis protein
LALNWENIEQWAVLLVDDEPDNCEVVAESLEFYGMTVKTAANGQLALATLQNWLPDLILMDLSMPVMDGWETLRRLKTDLQTENIPVLAFSAHAIIGDAERALAAGFDGYLTKPVNVPTLLKDLRAAFKEPAAEISLEDRPAPPEVGNPSLNGNHAHSTGASVGHYYRPSDHVS